jgi:TrwC relaxase
MLSITKLRVGQEAYQLSGVAQSLDDYYTGAGEADGVSVGGGGARLGLDGEVDPDDLRAVLAGLGPGWGGLTPNGQQPRPHPRRVPGFDLTFKAP